MRLPFQPDMLWVYRCPFGSRPHLGRQKGERLMTTLIKGGTIVTAQDEFKADLYIRGETIEAIGHHLQVQADEIVDAAGKYVLPGGVDQHVHFSFEFNGAKVRGFETAAAAVAGGTTTVIEFVNQIKGKGLVESIEDYRKQQADGVSAADYTFHSVLTDAREEVFLEIPQLAEAGYPTMKLFMAYKGMFFHADDDAILKSLMIARDAGVTVMVHAENADAIDVLQKQLVAEGKTGPYYHAVSRPPLVEAEATKRAIYLAKIADAPLYVVHVSCREALDEIGLAHAEGLRIKGETCTHYLTLQEQNLAKPNFEGAKYVCSPALRPPEHFDALWAGLHKGWLNAISSDHCGFDWKTQKHMGINDFRMIPNGAPGLEHRLAVLWSKGVAKGKLTRSQLVDFYATAPAKNNGIDHCKGSIAPGYDADIVLYDPEGQSIIHAENSLQGVDYTPYEGFTQIGRVDKVWLRGNLAMDDGKFIGQNGWGKLVKGRPFGLMYR